MKENTLILILLVIPIILISSLIIIKNNRPKEAQKEAITETANSIDKTKETSESIGMNETNTEVLKKDYKVTLKTTEGNITLVLSGTKTPKTVDNFVNLAKKGFYDNTVFHRVIDGFMIQGGDPSGNGTGGPGYTFEDEPFEGEYTRGTIAMANRGPDTNGSQFFIMHKDYALPKNYVIFGKVESGLEVVDKIATAETTMGVGGEKSKPVTPVKVLSISVDEIN